MSGYKATETAGVTRTYIIEKAIPKDADVPLDFGWIAYRQDAEGWEARNERMIGLGKTIAELVIYLSMHYPGSLCVAIWPLDSTDDDPRTPMILEGLGLGGHA